MRAIADGRAGCGGTALAGAGPIALGMTLAGAKDAAALQQEQLVHLQQQLEQLQARAQQAQAQQQAPPPELGQSPACMPPDADVGADPMRSPLYMSDAFRINVFKILSCSNRRPHDWSQCAFAHPGEKGRRRPLDRVPYEPRMCAFARRGEECPAGDKCLQAHNIFESYCHPAKYRTAMCNEGPMCTRKLCFFAHSPAELRAPSAVPRPPLATADSPQGSSDSSGGLFAVAPPPLATLPLQAAGTPLFGPGGGGAGNGRQALALQPADGPWLFAGPGGGQLQPLFQQQHQQLPHVQLLQPPQASAALLAGGPGCGAAAVGPLPQLAALQLGADGIGWGAAGGPHLLAGPAGGGAPLGADPQPPPLFFGIQHPQTQAQQLQRPVQLIVQQPYAGVPAAPAAAGPPAMVLMGGAAAAVPAAPLVPSGNPGSWIMLAPPPPTGPY
ncbi:hypothetical protein Rsub_04195 [Raphidocelis subcapitata]|uniref:C3H1-type domain-containing protein n=1 Tax=Raphidocelis subcapitata TaxID=307507 RepID=A0A2V0P300_9CHLO|nr:hypothetical protein Rsub_04195 [Raphidocelis subcapitata]|eukprot:GBF91455.1 hypothetical protein Rsub_04195 [Raphidocelis subcapitata]